MAPLTGDAFHDPTNTGPRETHNMRNGGTFSVYSSATISAPPKYVYDALLDTSKWSEWNTFVPDVRITKHPNSHKTHLKMTEGTCMVFTVQMRPGEPATTSKEVCTHIEPLKHRNDGHASHAQGGNVTRIRWALDNAGLVAPGFVVRAERVNEIQEGTTAGPDGVVTTNYRTWESFGGVMAGRIRKKYGDALQARFADWSRDLKARAEELYARDKGKGEEGEGEAVNGNAH